MLSKLGYLSMEDFVRDTVPPAIRISPDVINDETIVPLSESELFKRAKTLGGNNKSMRSYIGMGYHNAVVPPVILRNVSPNCVTGSRLDLTLSSLAYGESWMVYALHSIPTRNSPRCGI